MPRQDHDLVAITRNDRIEVAAGQAMERNATRHDVTGVHTIAECVKYALIHNPISSPK